MQKMATPSKRDHSGDVKQIIERSALRVYKLLGFSVHLKSSKHIDIRALEKVNIKDKYTLISLFASMPSSVFLEMHATRFVTPPKVTHTARIPRGPIALIIIVVWKPLAKEHSVRNRSRMSLVNFHASNTFPIDAVSTSTFIVFRWARIWL